MRVLSGKTRLVTMRIEVAAIESRHVADTQVRRKGSAPYRRVQRCTLQRATSWPVVDPPHQGRKFCAFHTHTPSAELLVEETVCLEWARPGWGDQPHCRRAAPCVAPREALRWVVSFFQQEGEGGGTGEHGKAAQTQPVAVAAGTRGSQPLRRHRACAGVSTTADVGTR